MDHRHIEVGQRIGIFGAVFEKLVEMVAYHRRTFASLHRRHSQIEIRVCSSAVLVRYLAH